MDYLDDSFKITYAQNREDIILDNLLKEVSKGFYIDVGAGHPIEDSVTKIFYEKGWTGINFEPIKHIYDLIVEDRPRDINLNVGVSNKKGKLSFREYKNYGMSTFTQGIKDNHFDLNEFSDSYVDYEVKVETLSSVFENNHVKNINFLKIDVEGLEYEVLEGNNWSKFRPQVLCIESNHIVKDWRTFLEAKGYEKVFNDGINDYYVSVESGLRKKFSYENTFLGEIRPIDFRVSRVVEKEVFNIEKKVNDLALMNSQLQATVNHLRRENGYLHNQLNLQFSPRFLLKNLLKSTDMYIKKTIYPYAYTHELLSPKTDIKIKKSNNLSLFLGSINAYDFGVLKKISYQSSFIRGKILKIYLLFRAIFKKLLFIALKIARKLKVALRNVK